MDILNKTFDLLLRPLLKSAAILPVMPKAKPDLADVAEFKTNYPFIFVSGFLSWGQYQKAYSSLPYWGFLTGEDYIASMNHSGYTAAAADVSPLGSAWDRACELYAQLTGTVVDYGRAHSEKYHHSRYGEDYTGKALITNWDQEHKINIICHSFGGPTSALFATLLADGSAEEREATADGSLSPLFAGGKSSYIHSITGIAGAYNGTTLIEGKQAVEDCVAYHRKCLPLFDYDPLFRLLEKMAEGFEKLMSGEIPLPDTGLYDMIPDNSAELNKNIRTVENIYYFTIPCCMSKEKGKKNAQVPDMKISDYFFLLSSEILGLVNYTTKSGLELKKDWQPNDGLVNTVSEYGPAGAKKVFLQKKPSRSALSDICEKGKYYVFETYQGSHNSISGGTIRPNRAAKPYLFELIKMINGL